MGAPAAPRAPRTPLTRAAPSRPDGSSFVFESGEAGLEEDEVAANAALRARLLTALPAGGLRSGDVLAVTDQSTALEFQLQLTHRAPWDAEAAPDGFLVLSEGSARPCNAAAEGKAEAAAPAADDEDCLIVEPGAAPAAGGKRAREEDTGGAAKKARAAAAADDDDDIVIL